MAIINTISSPDIANIDVIIGPAILKLLGFLQLNWSKLE